MRHLRLPCAILAAALLFPGVANAQALSEAEMNDITCFAVMSALSTQAEAAKKPQMFIDNFKITAMFFAGKLRQRHPGASIKGLLQTDKAALQANMPKFKAQACFTEAQDSLKP